MSELDALAAALTQAGGDRAVLDDPQTAHMAVSGHSILSMRKADGLEVAAKETRKGIRAEITVLEGARLERPVHLCFGMLGERGAQKIVMRVRFQKNARARFVAHCVFPGAERIRHVMDASVEIDEGAEMRYSEAHFHGLKGGVEVVPRAVIRVARGGAYFSDFSLSTGRVGKLAIDYQVDAGEDAVAELVARVFGRADDVIAIKEKVALNGRNSRGLIKTRIALADDARAEVTGITEGNAEGARGHVDCMELVKDRALAKAVPIVNVSNPLAKVTHEAAIGTVDKRQLETLMARGLAPDEAVNVIVEGILR
ncbi:MAG: SufD family Fe-S cluster assembly protein [Thermodesulfovibrionales bacterium]